MQINSIKSRGQNLFLGTDDGRSYVLNGLSIPVYLGMELTEVGDNLVQLGDKTFTVQHYDEAYHLAETDEADL